MRAHFLGRGIIDHHSSICGRHAPPFAAIGFSRQRVSCSKPLGLVDSIQLQPTQVNPLCA